MAQNLFPSDDEMSVSYLCHPWLLLDGCIYARVTRVLTDFGHRRTHDVEVIADNVSVYDQGLRRGNNWWPQGLVFEDPQTPLAVLMCGSDSTR